MKQTEEIYSNTKLSPILILVPTYNEIENIEKFIRQFYEHLNIDTIIQIIKALLWYPTE